MSEQIALVKRKLEIFRCGHNSLFERMNKREEENKTLKKNKYS
jgi:hypothetical protein